jgi:surface carbohydrate biosynthesis protein
VRESIKTEWGWVLLKSTPPQLYNQEKIKRDGIVFDYIKKTWNIFKYFIRAKPVWKWPQQSDVLIFDPAGHEVLLEYLKPWRPEMLHVRGEVINIGVLLKSFLRSGSRIEAYVDCFIDAVCPRLIVTYIDNNKHFYSISQRHLYVKTMFVQNGVRSCCFDIFRYLDSLDSETLNTFSVDHMLVFGSHIGEKYTRYFKGNITPIGSIKNNFVSKGGLPQPGVITFVSQWRKGLPFSQNGIFYTHEEIIEQPDRLVVQLLGSYAKNNNKRLKIILKTEQNTLVSLEKAYFKNILGYEPDFQKKQGPYSSYGFLDSSEVVVTIESTLGYESIARGNKTAIFSIRGTLCKISGWTFGWPADFPDEGLFWTNKPDPDSFVRILDYLFEVTDEQWQKDLKSTKYSSIMEYDPENTILQSIFEKELGASPKLASKLQ